MPGTNNQVAPELRGYLNERSKIQAFANADNATVTFSNGFYEATPNKTQLVLAGKVVPKPKKIFEEFANEILTINNLDLSILAKNPTGYFDKVFETAVESLLARVSDNNPLFETPQKLRDYPIVSWEKITDGDCVGPLFSVKEITEIHGTIWAIYCESGQPEPDKLAMNKIAYDIYLYVICLQHVLKAIFSLAVFEQSEIDNSNSFIVSKITEEIRESFGFEDNSIFAKNYKQLVAAQYEEESFDINFKVEVAKYTEMAFGKILERSTKLKFFDGFGEKNSLSSLKSLTKYVEKPEVSGFYRQNYFRMTPNANFKETLSPELKEIYNSLLIFLAYRIENNLETFGLDSLLLPGTFQFAGKALLKDFGDILPELSLDSTVFPKNLKDLGYLDAYDYRNIVFIENADKLRERLVGAAKPKDDYTKDDYTFFHEFCEPFNNYMINLGGLEVFKGGTNQLRKLLLALLDKPITDFFSEFRFGRRFVAMVRQEDLLLSENTIETVTEKVGNVIPYHVQLQLINYEKDLPSMTARDLIFEGLPIYEQPLANADDKAKAKRVASAIDLDFVEDIAVYLTYAGVEQIYGKRIDDLFKPTRKLARTNVEALSRITSYDQSTDTAASTSLTPSMNFDVFDVVFGAFLKAGANMTDPFWKTTIPGPLTPIGWAAKLYDSDQPPEDEKEGPPEKKKVCSDN